MSKSFVRSHRLSAGIGAMALLLAGCGSDAVANGGSCEEVDCEHFAVLCTDGTAAIRGGCVGASCLTQEDATSDACQDSAIDRVTAIPAGVQIPTLDSGNAPEPENDAGQTSTGAFDSSCVDNVQHLSGFNREIDGQDCTLNGTVCEEDVKNDATVCRPPVAGDDCYAEGTFGCTEDKRGALVCQDGSWNKTALECADASQCPYGGHRWVGCQSADGNLTTFSLAGGPCDKDGNATCSIDRSKVNVCRAGTWVTTKHCGPSVCKHQFRVEETDYSTETSGYYACANGGATLGDLCDPEDEGKVWCTIDLTAILECNSGTLQPFRTCSVGQQCGRILKDGKTVLSCRSSSYAVGEPCHFPEGTLICTADGSQILACESGVMAQRTACEVGTLCQDAEELGLPTVTCQ